MMRLDRFQRLVEEHQDRVLTFAHYYLGNAAEAEDVTQEVLLRLWHHLDQVETDRAGSWLSKVTRNACFDTLRSRRSQGRVFAQDAEADVVHNAEDRESRTDSRAAAWDVQRHVTKALAHLEEPYRSVIILREIQDLKYQEISAALDMPLNTVKTYIHRGRKMLRTHLQEVECYAVSG